MLNRIGLALIAVAVVALAACTTTEDEKENTQLAAQAAATTLPSDQSAMMSHDLAVVVDSGDTFRIYNFGKQAVNNADVWINVAYSYHVDTIPAMGYQRFDLSKFYNKAGHMATEQPIHIDTVQLNAGGAVWTLLGPVAQ